MIQKATELGVTKFLPIIFDRTIVRKINKERLEKVIIEAAEQSNRINVPVLEQPQNLKSFLKNDMDLIFTDLNASNKKIDLKMITANPTCVIIGPEGDFSEQERQEILKFKGVQPIKINENILRSETAVISALEDIPIRQDLAMTGSLSVRGEVLPIGGVTAKIEAAAGSGIKKVIVPRSNMQDVLLDDKYKDMVEVVAVDSLDEVMKHALIKHEHKESLVERLSSVIDILTPEVSNKSPSA